MFADRVVQATEYTDDVTLSFIMYFFTLNRFRSHENSVGARLHSTIYYFGLVYAHHG